MNRETALAVLVSATGQRAQGTIQRYLDAKYPTIIMTQEGPRAVDSVPRAEKEALRRDMDRAQRDIAKLADLFLQQAGFTLTGKQRKRK